MRDERDVQTVPPMAAGPQVARQSFRSEENDDECGEVEHPVHGVGHDFGHRPPLGQAAGDRRSHGKAQGQRQ